MGTVPGEQVVEICHLTPGNFGDEKLSCLPWNFHGNFELWRKALGIYKAILLGVSVIFAGLIFRWILDPYSIYIKALGAGLGAGCAGIVVMVAVKKW